MGGDFSQHNHSQGATPGGETINVSTTSGIRRDQNIGVEGSMGRSIGTFGVRVRGGRRSSRGRGQGMGASNTMNVSQSVIGGWLQQNLHQSQQQQQHYRELEQQQYREFFS
ncbi:hypothetical protein BVC80_9053g51 [Macleaya cordata]|uniref:Uncharacterized protein n=1 Tax=Macleaya cordata TaxID=56857 RepID=A0A200RAD3_MACCD|nr:hypothetical protein BVC80_9053g51 [Macleaya cordata]